MSITLFFIGQLIGLALAAMVCTRFQPVAVRVISYFFSLSFCATILVLSLAVACKQISRDGHPLTDLGRFITGPVFRFFFDISTDFYVLLAASFLLIAPQFMSYAFCGLLGCAQKPRFISFTTSMFYWSILKSIVTLAGVILGRASYGYWLGWAGLFPLEIVAAVNVLVAAFMLPLSRTCLSLLSKPPVSDLIRSSLEESSVYPLLVSIHRAATRHNETTTIRAAATSLIIRNLDEIRTLCAAVEHEVVADHSVAYESSAAKASDPEASKHSRQ